MKTLNESELQYVAGSGFFSAVGETVGYYVGYAIEKVNEVVAQNVEDGGNAGAFGG